jgi:succinate-acetate transporter protein
MDPALGFWFIALAAITISGVLASIAEGKFALTAVLGTLAAGAVLAAYGLAGGHLSVVHAAGWLFVISAVLAWYTATAMMLASAAGRTILPLFAKSGDANVPGRKPVEPIELAWAEPGVKKGQ